MDSDIIHNETFKDLAFLYRDTSLIEALVSEYWKERTNKPVGMYPFSMDPSGKINFI